MGIRKNTILYFSIETSSTCTMVITYTKIKEKLSSQIIHKELDKVPIKTIHFLPSSTVEGKSSPKISISKSALDLKSKNSLSKQKTRQKRFKFFQSYSRIDLCSMSRDNREKLEKDNMARNMTMMKMKLFGTTDEKKIQNKIEMVREKRKSDNSKFFIKNNFRKQRVQTAQKSREDIRSRSMKQRNRSLEYNRKKTIYWKGKLIG